MCLPQYPIHVLPPADHQRKRHTIPTSCVALLLERQPVISFVPQARPPQSFHLCMALTNYQGMEKGEDKREERGREERGRKERGREERGRKEGEQWRGEGNLR